MESMWRQEHIFLADASFLIYTIQNTKYDEYYVLYYS